MLAKIYLSVVSLLMNFNSNLTRKIIEGSIKYSRPSQKEREFNQRCPGEVEAIFYLRSALAKGALSLKS